ncbi:unnamed protein product [Vitrella brassicaformis CCMP3155]|uniref:Uncharacterized protein n=1 Tax=Vitrella brassicaformis (strain CCMP3155) TaxID=1169540 RepID=A0A0G4EF68_VITBC|nr:unnamed protein product [Vitrella brassicaformis CCMP3155]|eukprot:CEL94611.1 unnamed protein product [Vitrella brassicaformis CCMP3155]
MLFHKALVVAAAVLSLQLSFLAAPSLCSTVEGESKNEHHRASLKIDDDTVHIGDLGADCTYGNHRLRCTAWGIRTYLYTSVTLVDGVMMSCVNVKERTSRCYWGVYADEKECCAAESDEFKKVESGGTCDCPGDFPVNGRFDGESEAVIQSRLPMKCLYSWDKNKALRECDPDQLQQRWRFVQEDPAAGTYKIVSDQGREASCLISETNAVDVKECKDEDHASPFLWHVADIPTATGAKAGTGFFQIKADKGDKCLQAAGEKVQLQDCSSEESQWWLVFDLQGRKISGMESEVELKGAAHRGVPLRGAAGWGVVLVALGLLAAVF